MKLNIRNKLLLAFAAVLALTAIVGAVGVNAANTINNMLNSMYLNNLEPIRQVAVANQYLIYFDRDVLAHVIASDKPTMDALVTKMDDDEKQMMALLDEYRKTDLTDKEKELLAQFDAAWPEYRAIANKIIELSYAKNNEEAMALINGEGKDKIKVADDTLTALVKLNEELGKKAYDDSAVLYAQSRNIIIAVAVAAVLAGLGVAFFLARSMANAAKLMAQTAEQIAQTDLASLAQASAAIAGGDLTATATLQVKTLTYKSSDEMGDLAQAFNAMIARLQETGQSFVEMIANLRTLISQVTENAVSVGAASGATRRFRQPGGRSDLTDRHHHPAGRQRHRPADRRRHPHRRLRRTDETRH
ncbi:MAG: HAMP domain-containing protein [Chloroflexi bacterium]|nr:HAMP domain-containing protein [Chloroflexota bacterium]